MKKNVSLHDLALQHLDKLNHFRELIEELPEEINTFVKTAFTDRIDRTKKVLNKRERLNKLRNDEHTEKAPSKQGRKAIAAERAKSKIIPIGRKVIGRTLRPTDFNLSGWE